MQEQDGAGRHELNNVKHVNLSFEYHLAAVGLSLNEDHLDNLSGTPFPMAVPFLGDV